VVIVAHSRELVNQLSAVIARILAYAPSYRLCNLVSDQANNYAHIIVSTLGTLIKNCDGDTKSLDLTYLKVFVLDEADFFFSQDTTNFEDLSSFHLLL
jgi:superfamily II DNA/RNA helicase